MAALHTHVWVDWLAGGSGDVTTRSDCEDEGRKEGQLTHTRRVPSLPITNWPSIYVCSELLACVHCMYIHTYCAAIIPVCQAGQGGAGRAGRGVVY